MLWSIDQFRYIKIQPKTIDLSTRLWEITTKFEEFLYPPEPRAEAGVLIGVLGSAITYDTTQCFYF